ncbi:LacI family DNA-binding transcriptional regulator [Amaricoccus sp.]|uniref:LacI family DNA-binding transcriptional regulator n=1 Tax=Amaricoccus sp. TaxID=1872485 RepID=UPI002618C52A|nr:LacI family DNA-binding transcriptional regulator [uncultured Amaricoccus sp.]
MARGKVTSHDVARAAGVSRATVSIVLNHSNAAVIGDETRKRVQAVAAELGYRPNSVARMLKSGLTETVGLLITERRSLLVDGYIPLLFDGIGSVLRRRGYHVLLETLSPTRGKNPYTDLVESRRIDGLLMLSPRADDAALIELIESDYPIVLLGSIGHPKEISVGTLSTEGLRAAVDHVVGLGHRNIGSVPFSPPGFAAADHRLAELRTFLAGNGVQLRDDAIVRGDFSAESGYHATLELMAARPDLTAIFAGNDTIALGVIGALAQLKLSVPRDVSVVGFDDLPFAGFMAPPLTTVRIDARHQGQHAAEALLLRLTGKPVPEARRKFDSQFIARGSCAVPRST